MRLNALKQMAPRTEEGAPAVHLTAEQRLRRSVLSCLLFEDEFYEDGTSIAERITATAAEVRPEMVATLAIEARTQFHLRHAPLMLLSALAQTGRGSSLVADAIEAVLARADELTELLALYWRAGKRPLSKQLKAGLARAFQKFDGYQLAKYNRNAPIKLRDVLFLVHAKPKDATQAQVWKKLADRTLESPDTWEVALSAGANPKETFERLIRERRLGFLALLRNLRNMVEAGCDESLVRDAILARRGAERVLPFRYLAAARAAPLYEPALEQALMEAVLEGPVLAGRSIVLVDVSGSMETRLSSKSDLTRMDAAAMLAAVIPGNVRVFTFSNETVEVPARRGMAGVDAIVRSQSHAGTYLGAAIGKTNGLPHDRLIVLTDEQSRELVPDPAARHAYMINVASYRNGVGYGRWIHIDGFSETVLRFIQEHEAFAAA